MLERVVAESVGELEQRLKSICIRLKRRTFFLLSFGGSHLHAKAYFSKVPPLATQCHCHIRRTLSNDGRHGASADGELQNGAMNGCDANPLGQRARHDTPNHGSQRRFLLPPSGPGRDLRITFEDERDWGKGRRLRHERLFARVSTIVERCQLNIILVSDASARARTITLNWPHWVGGSVAIFALIVMF